MNRGNPFSSSYGRALRSTANANTNAQESKQDRTKKTSASKIRCLPKAIIDLFNAGAAASGQGNHGIALRNFEHCHPKYDKVYNDNLGTNFNNLNKEEASFLAEFYRITAEYYEEHADTIKDRDKRAYLTKAKDNLEKFLSVCDKKKLTLQDCGFNDYDDDVFANARDNLATLSTLLTPSKPATKVKGKRSRDEDAAPVPEQKPSSDAKKARTEPASAATASNNSPSSSSTSVEIKMDTTPVQQPFVAPQPAAPQLVQDGKDEKITTGNQSSATSPLVPPIPTPTAAISPDHDVIMHDQPSLQSSNSSASVGSGHTHAPHLQTAPTASSTDDYDALGDIPGFDFSSFDSSAADQDFRETPLTSFEDAELTTSAASSSQSGSLTMNGMDSRRYRNSNFGFPPPSSNPLPFSQEFLSSSSSFSSGLNNSNPAMNGQPNSFAGNASIRSSTSGGLRGNAMLAIEPETFILEALNSFRPS